ncbi:filamin-A-interacting protein 1-like isoform X2 [Xenia sp. Carnegie-2017]|uniref:filamin-A-interacting protein 1-like isoform X2 n=1 Tax=Xenia sp. Carnegie-2017 TaxID=2897299 RepID=UPI001F04F623|nr:filamin-A-interacting protein 1-like isoform X2 [Xenia sp. Carnegie-2017]
MERHCKSLKEVEEKHRMDVLNILKSFEFERKDLEKRLREEFERKEKTLKNQEECLKEGSVCVDKTNIKTEEGTTDEKLLEILDFEKELPQRKAQFLDSVDTTDNLVNVERKTKSLPVIEEENKQLSQALNRSKDEIIRLKNKAEDFMEDLNNVHRLIEDGSKECLELDSRSKILPETLTETKVSLSRSLGNAEETDANLEQAYSVLSFRLEELDVENEDLKQKVSNLELKVRRIIEEHELKCNVFNDRLDELTQNIFSYKCCEDSCLKEQIVNDLRKIRLQSASFELLEEYASISLRESLSTSSLEIDDINLFFELQTLEQILEMEIFDCGVFDLRMKDKLRLVLKEKEKKLLISYTVEKLRNEIRHAVVIQGAMEEMQKEFAKDFCVHEVVNEVLKQHFETSVTGRLDDTDATQDNGDVTCEHFNISDYMEKSFDKVLQKHSEDDSVKNNVKRSDDEKERGYLDNIKNSSDTSQNEELETSLQDLQNRFDQERQMWQEKQVALQGPEDSDDRDKELRCLKAREILMEDIWKKEIFNLSRLYYMEMKDEVNSRLKREKHNCKIKHEKNRLIDAWKHHAEVGELYQEILSKENETLENLQRTHEEDQVEEYDNDVLKQESFKIQQQLPLRFELLELQRKRCRDHKAANHIIEQAVVALETVMKEPNEFFNDEKRKSSWSSIEDNPGNECQYREDTNEKRID